MIEPPAFFDLLSHEMRLRALLLIRAGGSLCVCELCHILDCSQPKLSRHLAILRTTGVVKTERRGVWIYYQLGQLPEWMEKIIDSLASHLSTLEPYRSDAAEDLCCTSLCDTIKKCPPE